MKLAVAFVAILAVAAAGYIKPNDPTVAELEAIVAAIQSPSTDPATAVLLEQQLADLLEAHLPVPAPAPVVIEPAPIAIGPAFIDFPVPDGGALTPGLVPIAPEAPAVVPSPVVPSPVVVGPAESSPLVQIIVNVQSAGAVVPGAPAAPAPAPAPVEAVDPVTVVEEAVNPPTVVPTPVVVVDEAPAPEVEAPAPVVIAPEPIQIGEPIVPVPVVTLPEILN